MPSTKNGLRIVFIFANFFNRNITLFLRGRVTNSLPRTKSIPSVSATCMLSFRGERNASDKCSFQLYRNSDYLTTRPFQTAFTHERSLQCYYCPFSSPSISPLRSTSTTPSSTYSTCNSAGLLVASVFPLYFSLPCSQIPLHSNNQLASSPPRLLPRRRTRHRGRHRRHPEQEAEADQGGGGKRCERREAAQRGRTGREENRKRRLPRQTQGRAHRRTADYLEPFLRAITRSSFVLNLG